MEVLMMLCKNRNKKVGLCVMVVTASLVMATLWAVLATPETALAAKPDKPGGNVVKQDIPGVLTFTGSGSLTNDGAVPPEYSNSEAGTTCFIGRRRSIWVRLSKTSDRRMNLTLTELDVTPFDIQQGEDTIQINPGDDPWGNDTGITPPGLPTEQPMPISQVELQIAPYLNVSGLKENDPPLDASTWLLFLDGDNQWGLYFGPGRTSEDGWGGARFFTDLNTPCVEIECNVLNKSWTVTSTTPGFLWYKGSKKNAPWVYVGKYDIVPWSCTVVSLE